MALDVFEFSNDLLGAADLNGYFTTLNPAWEAALGFSRKALMAQPYIEFVHPADREATVAEARRLADLGTATVAFENRFAVKDGGWRWLSWQCALGDHGYHFVTHDVTERVATEQRRYLLDNLVEGVDDAILTKTEDGVITSWNPASAALYGYTASEAIGKSINLIVPEQRSAEPKLIVQRLLAGEGVRQYTTQRRHKSGAEVTVSLTASLLRDPGHKVLGVAVISRDVSGLDLEDIHTRAEMDTLVWVGRIRDAIDENRLVFHGQPIVSLNSTPRSWELLCRIVGRDGDVVPPARFLRAAEQYGLIEEVDLLAIDEAARLIANGHSVSVNLSTASVGRWHICDVIAEKLADAKADPSRLTIEITETALMADIDAAQRFTAAVTAMGCRVSLDDFGTGFGGFTYLKRLEIDQLKIDVEFVRDLHSNPASQHVVRAVVSLAQAFDVDTVAEGVEDEETFAVLAHYGVTHAQGDFFAKPGPIPEAAEPNPRYRNPDRSAG